MQNNFENDVRKRLDELNLTPTAPVWLNVEHQIRQDKNRRRRALWLIFPLAAGLGLGGFFMTRDDGKLAVAKVPEKLHKGNTSTGSERVGSENANSEFSKSQGMFNLNSADWILPNQLKDGKSKQLATVDKNGNPGFGIQEPTTPFIAEANTTPFTAQNNNTLTAPAIPAIPAVASIADPDEVTPPAQNLAKVGTPEPVKTERISNNPFTPVNMSKWSFGFTVGAGISSVVTPKQAAEDKAMSIVNIQSAPSLYAVNAVSNPQASSRQINSYAFTAGASVERKLNDHFSVSSGIHYRYYSSIIEKGEGTTHYLNDQGTDVRAAYFRSGNTISQFRNNFHYASIPVDVHYMPFKKVPVVISAGASYQRLLASDALIWHSEYGLLYANKVEMNKNLAFGRLGFEVRLPYGKNGILTVGPEFQASLSSIQDRENQRLLMAGVRARLLFGK